LWFTLINLISHDASQLTNASNISHKWQGILDEKNQQYTSSSFDSIVYILLNATNATILLTKVLSHVPIFNYVILKKYYNFKLFWDVQFRCLDNFRLWHIAQYRFAMWQANLNFCQNEFKLMFM
jgi:hypothetical protein